MTEDDGSRSRPLGELEQQVLLALAACGDEAPGPYVFDHLVAWTGRELTLPAVYITLNRLHEKGLVRVRTELSPPGRGGKPRKFYDLGPAGAAELRRLHFHFERLWTAACRHPLLAPGRRDDS